MQKRKTEENGDDICIEDVNTELLVDKLEWIKKRCYTDRTQEGEGIRIRIKDSHLYITKSKFISDLTYIFIVLGYYFINVK